LAEGEPVIKANDDANKSQSSNDTFPTGMHIAAYKSISYYRNYNTWSRKTRDNLHAKATEFKML
jgi:fumarate hydratase class II